MADDPGAVELRIHGVRGGEATELLDAAPEKHVAGDGHAGFFRARTADDRRTAPGAVREVFAWGNLTSGQASRAFWLLLLPFMLANMAYWMRPRRLGAGASRLHLTANHLYDTVVRLLALGLTVLLTLAAAGIGMDLAGWQCTGYGGDCAELRPWLGFLSAPESVFSAPGTALAIGALLPIALVGGLWRLSRRTGGRYEAVFDGHASRAGDARDGGDADPDADPDIPVHSRPAPLSHPRFWHGAHMVGQLRSAHIAAAACTVSGLLTLPALLHDLAAPPGTGTGPAAAGAVLAAFITGFALLSALFTGLPDPRVAAVERLGAALRAFAVATLPAAFAYTTLWPRPGWTAEGPLPGFGAAVHTVLAAQCLLGLLLFAVAFALYRGAGDRGTIAMRGMAGPATAALALLLGGVFSAALGYQAAEWLGGCLYPGAEQAGCLVFRVPTAYSWLQLAFTLSAAIMLALVAGLCLVLLRRARRGEERAARDYGRSPKDWPKRARAIAWARALGSLTGLLPVVLSALLVPAVALAALVGYLVAAGRYTPIRPDTTEELSPQRLAADLWGWMQDPVPVLVALGSVLGALFLASLLWLGRNAYQDQPTREIVGMLWDVGTFWPRAAHPLAPPCYAERAVPQLAARICKLTEEGTGVVISGHSQGSVLAAAVAWQLPPSCRGRVALLTHGSPLYRLYAHYFPAYFGPLALRDLKERVQGWRNLWRETDAIAGKIVLRPGPFPETVSCAGPIPDPSGFDCEDGEALPPPIQGHSWYTRDPRYAEALGGLAAAVSGNTEKTGDAGRAGSTPQQEGARGEP